MRYTKRAKQQAKAEQSRKDAEAKKIKQEVTAAHLLSSQSLPTLTQQFLVGAPPYTGAGLRALEGRISAVSGSDEE